MSKPKILHAVRELDRTGFYNNSVHLGDIRSNPTCLDSTLKNGIYTFTGGASSPTDATGSYRWTLDVRANEDCSKVQHRVERISFDDKRIIFVRYATYGTWSSFVEDSGSGSIIIREW